MAKPTVEELEGRRNEIAGEIAELKAEFHELGEAKAATILASPKGAALAKLSEARAELAAAIAEPGAEELGDG